MLLQIIQTGANAFIIIVCIIIAFVAGLATIDFLNTKEKGEQES